MNLDKRDNIHLMCECCTVKQIEYIQRGREESAEYFEDLKQEIKSAVKNSEELDFEMLHEQFDDVPEIQKFLNKMERYSAPALNREYYHRAVKAVEKEYGTTELNNKVKEKFFRENRIQNLKVRQNRKAVKYALIGMAASVAVALGIKGVKRTEPVEPIQTESQEVPDTENREEPPVVEETERTYNDLVQEVKETYIGDYNEANHTQFTTDDFDISFRQNQTIYKAKIGEEERYLYAYPENYQEEAVQYLESHQIEYTPIVAKTINVKPRAQLEEFLTKETAYGAPTFADIEAVVELENSETGEKEFVKLFDSPEELVNLATRNESTLSQIGGVVSCLGVASNEVDQEKFYEELEKYQETKKIENNRETEIEETELEMF